MTRDDIIRIAREAGVPVRGHYDEQGLTPQELERFAALVAEAEREACAAVCDARYMGDNNREDMEARRCAAAIRARGNV
jgi:ketopantoate hydroxymethyltransferase